MTAETESLVLEILKEIQADMADMREELKANRIWMASVDSHLTAIHLEITHVNARIDGLSKRIDRLEARLELA
jgi:predicted  nucleic acid-binding Zn-ribbon protein